MSVLRPSLFIALTGLFISTGAAAEDLLDAYQQAFLHNPGLQEARSQLQATLQERPLADAAFLPQLGLNASVGYNTGSFSGFAGLNINKAYLSNSYSVTLRQNLFDGQAFSALKEAGSEIQAQTAALAAAEQDLGLRVAKAYFAVLQAQAQLAISEKQSKLLDSIYRQTQATLKIGTGDIIAVREARARLDAARADEIQTQNALSIARKRLEELTHRPLGSLAPLRDYTAMGPRPDNMQSWVASALRSQPLILEAQAQELSAQAAVEYQRRARWPKLDLEAAAQHASGNPFPGLKENQAGVSLNLSMPIYDGGRISSSVQKAQAHSMAQNDHLESVRDQVTLNTQSAFLDLQNSVAQLKASQEAVSSAKTSLEGTRKGYDIGTRSIIDLLQTATDYIRAEQEYNVAFYHQIVSRVALKAAAGQLNISDLRSINGLLGSGKAG